MTACWRLADLLAKGVGGRSPDGARALELFRDGAEHGGPYCQLQLGLLYARGEGVEQDYVEAHKWVNLSAADGN
ncbi:hypothetical protein [Breoghania sp.]|uniref:tetratricopeptide repeat protein n=1 Tax=Breoghania sp. TaxID=2065378 RepID=UPI00261BA9C5|nr:hypothetical protein [Breoghania sp.]MDJ0933183.1 hypothetical protein [Breoghania sp.]